MAERPFVRARGKRTVGKTSRDVGSVYRPVWDRSLDVESGYVQKIHNEMNPWLCMSTLRLGCLRVIRIALSTHRRSEAPRLANSPAAGEARLPAGAPHRPSRLLCASPMPPSKGSLRLSCGRRCPVDAGWDLSRVVQQRQDGRSVCIYIGRRQLHGLASFAGRVSGLCINRRVLMCLGAQTPWNQEEQGVKSVIYLGLEPAWARPPRHAFCHNLSFFEAPCLLLLQPSPASVAGGPDDGEAGHEARTATA